MTKLKTKIRTYKFGRRIEVYTEKEYNNLTIIKKIKLWILDRLERN
jgi:hypothetical protein